DMRRGNLDWIDQVPFNAVNAVKKSSGVKVNQWPGGEITNITWNSNPRKPKNRELLNPQVKKALSMCVDRQQIISVIYAGNATLANQSVIGPFGIAWQSPDDQKLQFNCAEGNAMLDQL